MAAAPSAGLRRKAREWDRPQTHRHGGFSRGGHLATPRHEGFEKRTYEPQGDMTTRQQRPGLRIAVYPGYLRPKDKEELAPGLASRRRDAPIFRAPRGPNHKPAENSRCVYVPGPEAPPGYRRSCTFCTVAGAAHDFGDVEKSLSAAT